MSKRDDMKQILFIHDLEPDLAQTLWGSSLNNFQVVEAFGDYATCMGCFGCWVKTPGSCVIKDKLQEVSDMLAVSKEIIVVSKNYYGDLSPQIKRVWDRSIPYVLPFFRIVNGEMHHKLRYNQTPLMSVHFYGNDISPEEKQTSKELIKANAVNFGAEVKLVKFYTDCQDMGGILQ